MIKATHALLGAGLCLMSGALTGCGGDDPGVLVQNWTIASGTDPASCTRTRASQMRFVVLDEDGDVKATEFAPCTDFTNRLSLEDGTYTATATFLDSNNVAVSKTLLVGRFKVKENESRTLTIDFLVSDFL